MSASWAAWLGEGALASLLLAMAGNLAPCAGEVNNRIIRSHDFAPFHSRQATITLEACHNVRIDANHFEGDVLGKNITLQQTAESDLSVGAGQGWAR